MNILMMCSTKCLKVCDLIPAAIRNVMLVMNVQPSRALALVSVGGDIGADAVILHNKLVFRDSRYGHTTFTYDLFWLGPNFTRFIFLRIFELSKF